MGTWSCECRTIWCPLDNWLHAHRWHVRWICDRHDRFILGER